MLAERMANSLLNGGIITDEEKEIVQFGLENLGGNLLGFVIFYFSINIVIYTFDRIFSIFRETDKL